MSPRWLISVPVALALGMAIGRYTRGERTKDVYKTDVVYKDRVVEKVVHDVQVQHDVATQTRTVTVTRWAKAPDGSPVVTQETHAERDQQAETKRQARTDSAITKTSETESKSLELHETQRSPDWSASVLLGGQLGGRRLTDALPAPMVVGVALERRILGPVSAGLWATSGMAGGLSVRVDW
jgi:hypothetical protein